MKTMLISILIPVYNTPIEYIKECIQSINSQTHQDFEVIIVNDGSTDKTEEILKEYAADLVILKNDPNAGKGLHAA